MITFPSHLAQALASQPQERKRRSMTWQAVQDLVLARIQNGEWPEGQMIPTEAELAGEFGCARATVNRALQALAQSGVIERRRKVGTRVAQHPRVQMVRFLLRREIEAAGKEYGYTLLDYDECPAPADIAHPMLLRADEPLLRLRARFTADGAPYCCEERWINSYTTAGLNRAAIEKVSACEWILGNVPVNRGSLTIGAAVAGDGFVAEAMGLQASDPVLVTERIDWLNNMPVSLTRRFFPESHRFAATI